MSLVESQSHWADNSVLNLDKGPAVTSYRVVDQLKKLLRIAKAGHAGSLDPFATGVLLVCTGRATKITRFLMELEKEYRGTIRLGIETDTDDLTGEVLSSREDCSVSRDEAERAIQESVGRILQHPPRISALKQRGKRFYDMARRGESFDTEAREIMIHDFQLRAFRFPELEFSLRCSKGTYVRALARDLGRKLGCGAHLSALRRTRVGTFGEQDSTDLDALREAVEGDVGRLNPRSVASMDEALAFLPAFVLRPGEERGILYGQSPSASQFEVLDTGIGANQNVRILSSERELLAVGTTAPPEAEAVVRLQRVLVTTNEYEQ